LYESINRAALVLLSKSAGTFFRVDLKHLHPQSLMNEMAGEGEKINAMLET
jgi:hypothetical protein